MSIKSDKNDTLSSNSAIEEQDNKILGVVYGIGVNLNNIIGSGIVTTPGIVWGLLKSPGIVLSLWIVGGIVAMLGSLTYVELGGIHKVSGGETKYLETVYPRPKLLMSYLSSFMFILVIQPGILCAVLQSAAQYLWYTVKGHRYDLDMEQDKNGWHLHFSPFWSIKLIAVLLLLIITVYHMISNKWAVYINQTLAVIKLISYSIIAIAGIVRLITDWPTSRINWQHPLGGSTDITDYSASILLIMFSYNGWNSLNYSLDEFRKPEKNLVFSNSISVFIVIFIYLFVNVAFISVVPREDILNGNLTDETIAAAFFRQLFSGSEAAVRIFTGLVVLSVMGTAATGIWSGSRIITVAAKLKYFPIYSKELETRNERSNTPVNALLAQLIWCSFIIIVVGSSFTIASFTLFSTFSMYSYWIFYTATGIGLLRIRRCNNNNVNNDINDNNADDNVFRVPYHMVGIFILAGFYVLIFSFFVNDYHRIQKLSPIFMSYGFLLIASIFWYFLYYRRDKKKEEEALQ